MKLYLAKINTSVVFAANKNKDLRSLSIKYLKDDIFINSDDIDITEVTSVKDVPDCWRDRNSIIYGTNNEYNVSEALDKFKATVKKKADPDYQLYLQLKKRFEK